MALDSERLKDNILKKLEERCGYIITGYTLCFITTLAEEIVNEIKTHGECYDIIDRYNDRLKGKVK